MSERGRPPNGSPSQWPMTMIDENGNQKLITPQHGRRLMNGVSEDSPSYWPKTVVDNETGEQRIISQQRADQLLHPETLKTVQHRFYKTEHRKQYMRDYRKKYKAFL